MTAAPKPSHPKRPSHGPRRVSPTAPRLGRRGRGDAAPSLTAKPAFARSEPPRRPAPSQELPSLAGQAEPELRVCGVRGAQPSAPCPSRARRTRGDGAQQAHTPLSHQAPGPRLQRWSSYAYAQPSAPWVGNRPWCPPDQPRARPPPRARSHHHLGHKLSFAGEDEVPALHPVVDGLADHADAPDEAQLQGQVLRAEPSVRSEEQAYHTTITHPPTQHRRPPKKTGAQAEHHGLACAVNSVRAQLPARYPRCRLSGDRGAEGHPVPSVTELPSSTRGEDRDPQLSPLPAEAAS